ncbi:MAG: glycoside hydrolase family 92 protein [Planctomycetaceae bacterium]|nr:glycoside hydrolase family 92 protein [Planctomycetaceae bacterium]
MARGILTSFAVTVCLMIAVHATGESPKGQASPGTNLDCVDPTIGSVGIVLEPTRPTVHLPNSLVRSYPMKRDQLDDQVQFFPLTVASHRIAWVFAMLPVSGPLGDELWGKRATIEREETTPYYYHATFEDSGDAVAFSPAARSGYFQINFEGRRDHWLRLAVINQGGEISAKGRVISGTEEFQGMHAYFYAETDADITDVRYQNPADKRRLLAKVGEETAQVGFRYGISYISVEQAKRNFEKEIPAWGFDAIKEKAREVWEKTLSQVRIEGGTPAQRRVFWTALYRCYERMVDVNEYGQYYSAYDHRVHQSNEPFYVDNWLWDTYRGLEPLHMILNPDMEMAKIRSYITMYEQAGWMPSFAVVFGDWPAMTGNNAAIWMTDAWFKGLRQFDFRKAYEGAKKNSLEATLLPWANGPATSLDEFYNKHGYMPGLHPGEKETVAKVDPNWEKRQCVSVTLDNSYSDWCIAQLAAFDNNRSDRDLFMKRANNYKNVFRTEKGCVWPKDAEGRWIEPFDPKLAGREYFTENNGYTYNWDVVHDLHGLFALMGGRAKAEAKLDQLFREDLGLPKFKFWTIQPDASGMVGQFVMGNEPSFHIPYLHDYLGAPWKTQKRVRMLLDTWFTDNLFGMPGDEDGGGMSAFVVFSMMGFFPATPGIPVYAIGSPVFDETSIKLSNGKTFTVKAVNNSAANKYIQSATLNGKPWGKPWFTHADLLGGGVLELTMGKQPNKEWGSREADAPPSSLDYRPSDLN